MSAPRKRADRRTVGALLPEVLRTPNRRCEPILGEKRNWTVGEGIALAASIVSCESEGIYNRNCVAVLKLLSRSPVYAEKSLPSASHVADDCFRYVGTRFNSNVLRGYNGLRPWVGGRSCDSRKGTPLTWGERAMTLKPWVKRDFSDRLPLENLFDVLFRPTTDRPLVETYSMQVLAYRCIREPQNSNAPAPIRDDNTAFLYSLIGSIDALIASAARDSHVVECVQEMLSSMRRKPS